MSNPVPPGAALSAAFFDHVRDAPFQGRLLQAQVDGLNALANVWADDGDGDPHKLAYVLASAYHETAGEMAPICERGARAYFDKYEPGTKLGDELGSTRKGDGFLYRGRGFVQITGRANYARAGRVLTIDLIGNPELALDLATAAKIAICGMRDGWFTGKTLGDYIKPGSIDYVGARRVVNGKDRAETIALYAANFAKALAA